jgi:pyrroloquinoline quinone (PQQ) biosynthesis protein C
MRSRARPSAEGESIVSVKPINVEHAAHVLCEPTPEYPWINELKNYLRPEWQELIDGEFVTGVVNGTWSVQAMRGWILQLYPFIHAFPKFLAEGLLKVEDEHARSFLIDNIRVEKAHADHWLWMGEGFGLAARELGALAGGERTLLRDVQSLSDWLWFINAKGSLAEAVAATSFAVEGAAGDLSQALMKGFEVYRSRDGVTVNARTTKWARNHAKYDDDHPRIALKIVGRYATDERVRMKAMAAARRSLQLLNLALLSAARAFSCDSLSLAPHAITVRINERRQAHQPIGFPDRRIVDRRKPVGSDAERQQRA